MGDMVLFFIVSGVVFTQPDAGEYAAQAYYKQTGIEQFVEDWTNRNTSAELRARVGEVSVVTQVLVTKRISLEWRF